MLKIRISSRFLNCKVLAADPLLITYVVFFFQICMNNAFRDALRTVIDSKSVFVIKIVLKLEFDDEN